MTTHSWKFSRIGGFDQALIQTADDLRHLDELDPKLWAALSCPVHGLEFDERTLALIDHDKDGRVREPEVKAAVAWVCAVLKEPALILNPKDEILLTDIQTQTDQGTALAASAAEILRSLGKDAAAAITLADVAAHHQGYAKQALNGDGYVSADSTDDADLKHTLADIIKAFPTVKDAFGQPGVGAAEVAEFFKQSEARLSWLEAKAAIAPDAPIALDDSLAVYTAVTAKIDDYFSRVRVYQYQPATAPSLNAKEADWQASLTPELSAKVAEIAHFPLAVVNEQAEQGLPLGAELNPAWQGAMSLFIDRVTTPMFGELTHLSENQWQQIKDLFKPYQDWLAAEVAQSLAGIDGERLRELLAGDQRARLEALISSDAALAPQAQNFAAVEQLLLYRLHLAELLRNFVNFSDFYSPTQLAMFQAGTLYLDGRACELCIEVRDAAKHAALAGLSKCFLAYCSLSRPSGTKKDIVAAFTAGDSEYLLVGRNGVFIDRDGLDWDATITKLIENPISIPQAFFLPYKRLIRFVEEQAAKRAASADASADKMLQSSSQKAGDASQGKVAEKPKIDVGIVAALGVAVGGIATAFGMLLQAFFGLGWMMPLGLLGMVLVISGPSMFIAWLKLRQRNLGPILDATGWAVNGRVKINIPFGATLTEVAKLPPNARRELHDPYAEKRFPWRRLILAVALIVLAAGLLIYKAQHTVWPWQPLPSTAQEQAPQ